MRSTATGNFGETQKAERQQVNEYDPGYQDWVAEQVKKV
jgi:hypothetical protein